MDVWACYAGTLACSVKCSAVRVLTCLRTRSCLYGIQMMQARVRSNIVSLKYQRAPLCILLY